VSSGSRYLAEDLYDYIVSVSVREQDPVAARLVAETARFSNASMQISPLQGQFMSLLARLIDARRTIEVGVFTGYSALCVARALPAGGRLVACELNEEYAAIGRRFWEEAGVLDKIDLRLGPALETLESLLADGEAGTFDLGFIDADKENYGAYYERLLELTRPGGLILIDNVLWGGLVLDPTRDDVDTNAIRALNEKLLTDELVDLTLLPIGDGLTLARKH
jgi:caffeoyl-CoA O-methyltransferase